MATAAVSSKHLLYIIKIETLTDHFCVGREGQLPRGRRGGQPAGRRDRGLGELPLTLVTEIFPFIHPLCKTNPY